MTLTERAREILDGASGGRIFPDDVTYVRSKLAELLHEAMCEVCLYCKEKIPVDQLLENSFTHDLKGRGSIYCLASPIRKLLKG